MRFVLSCLDAFVKKRSNPGQKTTRKARYVKDGHECSCAIMTETDSSSMAKQVRPDVESFARIRVVGVGGSGGNTINHMVSTHVIGVDFLSVNTDAHDLHKSRARQKIHIGRNLTRGLGTGMDPDLGKQAAEETREEIQEALKGS